MNLTALVPQVAGGENKSAAAFGDKRAVAAMVGMSTRWVDGELSRGMPHMKLGPRRVRFDMAEVRTWLNEKYATIRHGKIAT